MQITVQARHLGVLALLKGVQFNRLKRQDKRFLKQFWGATSLDAAAELANQSPGAAARVAQAGYAAIQVGESAHATDLSHSINHQDRLERSLRQQIVRERRSLETGLAVLASIGSTSPFIGLFGTVWGIRVLALIGHLRCAATENWPDAGRVRILSVFPASR